MTEERDRARWVAGKRAEYELEQACAELRGADPEQLHARLAPWREEDLAWIRRLTASSSPVEYRAGARQLLEVHVQEGLTRLGTMLAHPPGTVHRPAILRQIRALATEQLRVIEALDPDATQASHLDELHAELITMLNDQVKVSLVAGEYQRRPTPRAVPEVAPASPSPASQRVDPHAVVTVRSPPRAWLAARPAGRPHPGGTAAR